MDDLVQPNAKQGKFREHSIKSLLFLIANSLQLAVESRERENTKITKEKTEITDFVLGRNTLSLLEPDSCKLLA